MRKIKFQGKRLKNGEWVCGCLTRYSEEMSYITVDLIENEVYQVDASTVGQYTGIKDKNGKEIYEGDITQDVDTGKTFEIMYQGHMFMRYERKPMYMFYTLDGDCLEVIGNIHDNPELLECDSP